MNSNLSFLVPCMFFLFIAMALLLFRRVPEKPVLGSASKQLSPSRLTTHPTQQPAKRGGLSMAVADG